MAITTTTITKAAGWARTDVIDQLEQAFTWLNLHGTQISGLVTSISAYSGGGTVGTAGTDYYDVPVATTSGIGTGATFDVYRSGGAVNAIYVNRPGVGYTNGEYITLSAADIGGTANGAVAIGITVFVDGGASPVGYGSTNAFFDKNFTPTDTNRPWGVLKQDFDTNKRFGVTYRGFKVYSNYQMTLYAGSSFFPFNTTNTSDKGGQRRDSFRGTLLLDIPADPNSASNSLDSSDSDTYGSQVSAQYDDLFRFATDNSPTTHDLKLNIYRSGIDPNFAVLSYNQPTVTGTLNDSTFSTFIIHDFTSSLYNFNEVFSAGVTFVVPDPSLNSQNGNTGMIGFRTLLSGNKYYSENALTGRAAEMGWSQVYSEGNNNGMAAQNYNIASSQTNYTSNSNTGMDTFDSIRNMTATIFSRTNGFKDKGYTDSAITYSNRYPITTYTSVIKGIPINGNLIPCPYYMPDDFVLIDFKLTASGQDIKQGDTITISGSEVYTVITGSYNKYGETAGILFCARTV